jgi:protein-S-isoprenylcysteine O-methyltransferase Ste14
MLFRKLILGGLFNLVVLSGLLCIPARTLDWWRAWVFIGVFVFGMAVTALLLLRVDKGLLEERMKPLLQKGQPFVDQIVVVVLLTGFVGLIVLIPFDVFWLHLLPKPKVLVSSAGLVLFIAGWSIMTVAVLQNAFATSVVRYQQERQHKVIDNGLYGVVRHPMYAGAVPLLIGMPLWLESYAGAIFASVPIATLAWRILIEERFLKKELMGYDAYTARVRYRLIPFLW